jgi:hypothetical protein
MLCYFFALSSKLPAQPTQTKLGCFLRLAFLPWLHLLNSLTYIFKV